MILQEIPIQTMRPVLAILVLASASCGTWGRLPNPIDLGYGYDKDTIVFPGGTPYKVIDQFTGETNGGTWYAKNDFETAEHCGTHLDAPYHFDKNGRKVNEIPLDRLITKAILVDVSADVKDNSSYALPVKKLEEWTKTNGDIPDKSVILIKFGWGSRYPNKEQYLGPSDTDQRYPGLSEEAAQWIVDTKKFVGVGVDTLSLDRPGNPKKPNHVKILGSDMYGLENVNLTSDLPPQFDLLVMPIKLINGTGGPVRIIAH
ncbi:Putative cyclase [Nesidiocoris tenuis]|uniref:Cyclase n=1 Tax=Nesidiocoris tenuis TaxID=355587 RepID=A0ABN7A5M6_9HEMI|nr:Putative cyclase [Nesidiocoris tenuis]